MIDPRLVMMEGVAPGIGKSTLAASLARVLEERGTPTDLFPEEALFTRPEFANVAKGFKEKNFPTPDDFIPAYTATIERMGANKAWGIFDWNCAGMASDLPWAMAEPARLLALVREVRSIAADLVPVVFSLDGDIREATNRATAQRGQAWVDRWAGIAADHGAPAGPDLERIVHYHQQSQALRQTDIDVLKEAGWIVLPLDATAAAGDVLSQALSSLGLQSS